ncbi:MAG: AbrB/MazE/SpoVT family DNA-binding domain-containing protein [bacterium]|nr:AbrB/MazE/SpoVT family DNA-binding domain-containing protein [bacterium]
MQTVVSSKGQIVLPAELRQQDGIQPGQTFKVERVAQGEYRLVAADPPRNQGLVDKLLDCPAQGWFMPNKDSFIAATSLAHAIPLATLNRRDFEPCGIDLIDPRPD